MSWYGFFGLGGGLWLRFIEKILLLVILLWSSIWFVMPSSLHASHVSTSLPGVRPGDNATYIITGVSWQTDNTTEFPINPFAGSDIVRAFVIQVTAVTGANVTFAGLSLLNRPPSGGYRPLNSTENIDVQTLSWCGTVILPTGNRTSCSLEVLPQVIIASGLTAPDAIGANPSVTLNLTLTRMVVGVSRTVNILNETVFRPANESGGCLPGALGLSCSNETISYGFAWDQASGIEVGSSYSDEYNSTEGFAKGTTSLTLVSTNIFAPPPLQDFTIEMPPSIEFQTGSSGTATITLSSQNGLTSSIRLTVDAPTTVACTLDHSTVQGSGTATLTCNGPPGTYPVTIYASSGYSTRQTKTTVKVDPLSTSNKASNTLPMTYVYIAAAAVVILTVVGAIVLLRRKHSTLTAFPPESLLSVRAGPPGPSQSATS